MKNLIVASTSTIFGGTYLSYLMGENGKKFASIEFNRKMLFKKLESWMLEYAKKYD